MKCVGFIGKIDKIDMVCYIAKIISAMGKKVIIVDATSTQKTRYTVSSIDDIADRNQYVTQHDGVDIAVGFSNMLELKKYLLSNGEDFNEYDYVLVDTDMVEMLEEYDLKSANKNFFVSSYDKYYITKGIDLLKFLCALKRRTEPDGIIPINKVVYYSDLNTADSKYIELMSENLPIEWSSKALNIPYDQGDLSVNIQNQYANKFDLKLLSKQYKETLAQMVELIIDDTSANVRKVIKNVEKSAKFSA